MSDAPVLKKRALKHRIMREPKQEAALLIQAASKFFELEDFEQAADCASRFKRICQKLREKQ